MNMWKMKKWFWMILSRLSLSLSQTFSDLFPAKLLVKIYSKFSSARNKRCCTDLIKFKILTVALCNALSGCLAWSPF